MSNRIEFVVEGSGRFPWDVDYLERAWDRTFRDGTGFCDD